MTERNKGLAKDSSAARLEDKLLTVIDAVAAANTITSEPLLSEIADLREEISRLCHAGEPDKATRLADLVVSRLRAGEPAKE